MRWITSGGSPPYDAASVGEQAVGFALKYREVDSDALGGLAADGIQHMRRQTRRSGRGGGFRKKSQCEQRGTRTDESSSTHRRHNAAP